MGRFRNIESDDSSEAGIDISPLIDCVFILLIFFIVTTVFVEEPGVDIEKSPAVTSEQLEKNSLIIAVTPDGDVVYGGREIGVGGVQGLIRRELQKENMPVIIQADTNARSALLVRVLGEVKLAGATEVSIATRRAGGR